MKTIDRIIMWVIIQLAVIALLYNLGLIPSHIILDKLAWGGNSGFKWALSYAIYFIPYCLLICLIYTIVGVLVTKKVPIHIKKWWIIAASCYAAFLIITGLVFYLATGYAFYDEYGAAIIDVWIAPLLWLGEVELYYWIARKRKEPKPAVLKLWKGLHYGIKWIMIQYLVFLILALIILIPTGRDIMFSLGRGGSPAYNADTGLFVAIPLYTFLFACWHSFFSNMKQCWTYIVPWAVIMLLAYLHVAQIRDWYFQIITVDDYMLGMWLAPAFGVVIQTPLLLLCFLIRNLLQKKAIHR